MANNHVSSLLNVDLPKPKRSNFNLGRVNRFSADVGWVIPCYVEEILPNSYKRLDIEALIQTNATVAPLMGSFKVKVDAFFVPLRLYHRHLDLNNIDVDFDADFGFHYIKFPTTTNTVSCKLISTTSDPASTFPLRVPKAPRPNTIYYYTNFRTVREGQNAVQSYEVPLQVGPSTLLDYLGILPVGYSLASWSGEKNLNATPLIGYFDIWRNFYSNPHDRKVPFRVQNSVVVDRTRDEVNYDYKDAYYDLARFDGFIRDINAQSISSSGQPISVNVYGLFNQHFLSEPTNFFSAPPLFAGSIFSDDYVDTSIQEVTIADTRDSMHFGLLPRTYNDDYFIARFSNEFVTYMEDTAVVTVENNQFTIDQLRWSNRIAKYIDKSIFADTRFGSWIKAHYGVKTNQKLNIPQFLGSITSNIVFNDIYATAQTGNGGITENQALGSRSSLGQGYIKNKGSFVEFKATEPGYLMCMFSIVPYVSYFQGIKKMYLKDNFYDVYRPEFDAVGYDDLQKLELFAVGSHRDPYIPSQDVNLDINEYNTAVGKHPSWLEYMTSYDESHGLFTQKYQYGFWVLNRPFALNVYNEDYDEIGETLNLGVLPAVNPTTYIRPEIFNSIFAVDKFTDNFQVQMRIYDKTKQPLSKQILPHL